MKNLSSKVAASTCLFDVSVTATSQAFQPAADAVALQLGVAFNHEALFSLVVGAAGVGLKDNRSRQKPVYIDLLKTAARRGGGRGRSLLAQATGVRPGKQLRVVDCTAGFGRDGFMLAVLGAAHVELVERSAALVAMLEDAWGRSVTTVGDNSSPFGKALAATTIVHADAADHLSRCRADVVYIDPMFPPHRGTALAKGDMQLLQRFLGDSRPEETSRLLGAAADSDCRRIVCKRHRTQPASVLPGLGAPEFSVEGKAFRFDVYLR